MDRIKYFRAKRSAENPYWQEIYTKFSEKNIPVYTEPKNSEISVALGGRMENPLPLKGKRVLAYKEDEWHMLPWSVYKMVLEEYYDDFINTTGLTPGDTVYHIQKKCENL